MLTLTQLRAFDAVARHRHFTRAAEELLVAQPSVSYQVRELERELGVSLVEVVGRRVYLTDAGERLAVRAVGLLNELEDAERELRDYAAGVAGRLRIGATRTVGGYALPPLLASFRESHPGIDLRLAVDNTQVIEQLLLRREVDLAIAEWQVESPRLKSEPLRRDALVLVAPLDHPLAARASLSREDLRGQAFVVREVGSGTRALAELALGPVLPETRIVLELDQPEAIVRAVEAGMGLAFLSEVIVARPLAAGTLRALRVEGVDLWRDFSLVTLEGRVVSPAMTAFAGHVRNAWRSEPTPRPPGRDASPRTPRG